MKYQVSSISILQTSKIVAILYAIFGLILVPFGCFFLFLGTEDPVNLIIGVFYLFGPIFYGVLGFIFTAIGVWLYNLLANRVGGIEFELKEVAGPEPQSARSVNLRT